MPASHLSLHYHLIFSTRDRIAYLEPEWRVSLHTHLGDIINNLGGVAEKIGGVEDHVHLLIGLRATHRLSDVVREVKSASSKWVYEEMKKPQFTWQDGYGAFTVSASKIEVVREYIARQEEIHRQKTFQEEYLKFLEESGIKYDVKNLW
jgi:putative transposase